MSASNAINGFGSIIAYESDTPGTYTDFAEITSITPPAIKGETADVTHMASPDGAREFIATLIDGGEVTFGLNYRGAQADTLLGFLRTKKNYRITLPNADTWTFAGIITNISGAIQLADKITQDVTLKVSGKPAHVTD